MVTAASGGQSPPPCEVPSTRILLGDAVGSHSLQDLFLVFHNMTRTKTQYLLQAAERQSSPDARSGSDAGADTSGSQVQRFVRLGTRLHNSDTTRHCQG